MQRAVAALVTTIALIGCAPDAPPTHAETRAAVIFGDDDRRDVHAFPDATFRDLARESSLVVLRPGRLSFSAVGVSFSASRQLGPTMNLCAGEPFFEQTSQATCSATLIDNDLVLTAGHCVKTLEDCQSRNYVFDFYEDSPGTLATIDDEDVYLCAQRLVWRNSDDWTQDYAIVQLDRPVRHPDGTPRAVAPIAPVDEARAIGSEVISISAPLGLPIKIADAGYVLYSRPPLLDFFGFSGDLFPGSSGGGVYDTSGQLVGIQANGLEPFNEVGGCNQIRRLPQAGIIGESAMEAMYVHRAIDELCASGFPSARLCGIAPSCGDGMCTGLEDSGSCSADCDPPQCGNGTCDTGELFICRDCSFIPFEPSAPPPGWSCPSAQFDSGDGCHCGCGAYDPDCDGERRRTIGCGHAERCTATGTCEPDPDARTSPDGWTCFAATYDQADGCHCDCGLADPDCDEPTAEVIGCAVEGSTCSAGACVPPPGVDAGPPATTDGGAPGVDAGEVTPGTDAGEITPGADAGPATDTDGGCAVSPARRGAPLGLPFVAIALFAAWRRRPRRRSGAELRLET